MVRLSEPSFWFSHVFGAVSTIASAAPGCKDLSQLPEEGLDAPALEGLEGLDGFEEGQMWQARTRIT